MRANFIKLLSISLTFFITSCAQAPKKQITLDPKCSEKRAAFDIGSGTTKVKLAEVDICGKKIFAYIWEDSIKISYQEDLISSGKKKIFSPQILEEGRAQFASLMDKAVAAGAKRAGGVATQAFREAKNGRKFIEQLEEIANEYMPTQLLVISQDLEARIGFEAGVAASGVKPSDAIVWDIGGGSQQIVATDFMQPKRLIAYKSEVASTRFMQKFKLSTQYGHQTPNPIGKMGYARGIEVAKRLAQTTVPAVLRDRLTTDNKVIGIGGVHSKSIVEQVNKKTYTISDLEKIAHERSQWTDAKIGGAYANTQVTNLILVLGFMKYLGIQQVTAVDANLATGVLLTNEFWRDRY